MARGSERERKDFLYEPEAVARCGAEVSEKASLASHARSMPITRAFPFLPERRDPFLWR
jgi:hypothetical protein